MITFIPREDEGRAQAGIRAATRAVGVFIMCFPLLVHHLGKKTIAAIRGLGI